MFHVGQMVVCVDGKVRRPTQNKVIYPVERMVYTIRAIDPDGLRGIWLEEVVNKPAEWREGYHEVTFAEDRFRPVRDTKKQVEALRHLLVNPPKELVA